jgi:hypothetical protein
MRRAFIGGSMFFGAALAWSGYAIAEDFVRIQGAVCATPPVLHCPDSECSSATVINQGQVVEMKSRRTYFLDYPCDLKPGEKVTFVLSLHGGGSYGNWQRHYFPIMDYKDKYRLVIATPNSPIRVWTDADDQYLRDIVEFVVGQLDKDNIKAFWLVGHSQGGMTSNRILRSDFFSSKVDGWLSLSGGRLGGNPGRAATFAPGAPSNPAAALPAASTQAMGSMFAQAAKLLTEMPANDISFIYSTGEREVDDKGVPQTSDVATKLSCGARQAPREVVDSRAGYVYDSSRLNQMRPGWGLLPAPGKAEVLAYPNCKDGRVVADVVRLQKGHTEGLEPVVTEELVKLMLSAPGGRIQRGG